MPLYNWDECQKGHLNWVNIDGVSSELDFKHFEELQNQYIARYDLRDDVIKHLKLKMLLTKLRLMYIETGDAMLLNQIEIETINHELANPYNNKGMTIDESLAWLRTKCPSWIKKKEITVVEFRDLLNEYGRGSKEK